MLRDYVNGLRDSLVIVIGYVPVAVVFGMTARAFGFTPLEAVLASALIFAGMSQFILVSLASFSLVYAVLLASLVNLRHIVYGCVLSQKQNLRKKPLIAFGLTDEVFVLSVYRQNINEHYALGLITGAYTSWVLGTLVGILFTEVAGALGMLKDLEFALIALFIAILVLYVENFNDILVVLYSVIISATLALLGLSQISPLVATLFIALISIMLEKVRKNGVC
ncbi:MAG: branched-chain amino acid ABC transporter permease [Crenarchaeota archaeon]|nr:branched-chain amino acid ABC transporter permease [Thermoproteota archaeon]